MAAATVAALPSSLKVVALDTTLLRQQPSKQQQRSSVNAQGFRLDDMRCCSPLLLPCCPRGGRRPLLPLPAGVSSSVP